MTFFPEEAETINCMGKPEMISYTEEPEMTIWKEAWGQTPITLKPETEMIRFIIMIP